MLLQQILESKIESAVVLSHNARPRRNVPNRDMIQTDSGPNVGRRSLIREENPVLLPTGLPS